jgi:hypothetical protein
MAESVQDAGIRETPVLAIQQQGIYTIVDATRDPISISTELRLVFDQLEGAMSTGAEAMREPS